MGGRRRHDRARAARRRRPRSPPAPSAASSPRSAASGGRCGRSRESPSGACWPARSRRIAIGNRHLRSRPRAPARPRHSGCRIRWLLGARADAAASLGRRDGSERGAFFGAGALLLAACSRRSRAFWLRQPAALAAAGHGWWPVSRLGLRNASYRPGRSVLVDCVDRLGDVHPRFRSMRSAGTAPSRRPIRAPAPAATRCSSKRCCRSRTIRTAPTAASCSGSPVADDVGVEPFRLLPGDDASCLNLYAPRQPRILGVTRGVRREGPLRVPGSLAATDAERANPWLLLEPRAGRRRGSGDCRRQLDDLRPAQVARRRHRHRPRGRPSGCGWSPRCPTACSRASC